MQSKFLFFVKAGLAVCIFLISLNLSAQKRKVIIDADTGNEIDDALALVLALKSEQFDVIGICAEQWHYQLYDGFDSMEKSWKLNNEILEALDMTHIPSLKGTELSLKRPQLGGNPNPRWGDAIDFMVEKALEMPEGEKLTIICLGAFTNVTSAILKEPGIIDKIDLYIIGAIYHFEKNAWNKNEFNVRNDLNAFDVLMNTKGLETHLMPANIAGEIIFNSHETLGRLNKNVPIENFLIKRWEEVVKDKKEWIMWDLAIIEALLHPEWTKEIQVDNPPENERRQINIYSEIDVDSIISNFWNTLKK